MSLANKKPVIRKAIARFGEIITISKPSFNKFKEPEGYRETGEFRGFYYTSSNGAGGIKINSNIPGEVVVDKKHSVMAMIDDETEAIKKGDRLTLSEKEYTVLDVSVEFDLYMNITLERAD